ncbi:hypothetical protein C8F01DRAFT_1047838 [Mycena amicta]|nr:hypothetical protein C8F01DRAFT_1047838 [Mycena amicta]
MNVWNGWPDGRFQARFSAEDYGRTGKLAIYWVHEVLHGHRGSARALTADRGKETILRCLGVIACDSAQCTDPMQIAPERSLKLRLRQLDVPCLCGYPLSYRECGVRCSVSQFRDGAFLNPTAGPSKLIAGLPTLDGPSQSVTDISSLLHNRDAVEYRRNRILKSSKAFSDDHFLKKIGELAKKYPELVPTVHVDGAVSVITLQSPFMQSMLVKDAVETEAVNGMVTDAAHGFFRDAKELLITSSVYEPVHLECWVPGILSYANGATSEHYRVHFSHLFHAVERECEKTMRKLVDELFANVCIVVDFSQAQQAGFIDAFIDFYRARSDDERSVKELDAAARALLRGCAQHFKAQINRVKRITGVVDPSQVTIFENYALKFLEIDNLEDFQRHVQEFIRTFSRAKEWIEWWAQPSHAVMLFPSNRTMPERTWAGLPATTNPQEAMNKKIYVFHGKHHALFDGLEAMARFAQYFEKQYHAARRMFCSHSLCTR